MPTGKQQNSIADTFDQETDLLEREDQIVQEVSRMTGFVPAKLLGRSSFWGSPKIGAFHYAGKQEGKDAVLKVQGIKPMTSEIYMLESFQERNKSSIIRPPYLYASVPWDDEKRYEALIMEDIKGDKVISHPSNEHEVDKFFELYEDYRKNCLAQPWIDKPDRSIEASIEESFAKLSKASFEVHPNHPLRKSEDAELVDQALNVLRAGYKDVNLEFQHGHFSADDLYVVGNHVVLLSNLYWSWRIPLYDAIFAYHWYIYRIANAVDNLTPDDIDAHRALWLSRIYDLPQVHSEQSRLLDLALIERETAGLIMDALTVDPQRAIAEYVVESTRTRVRELIAKASQ